MKIPLNIFPQLVDTLLRQGAIKALKIFDDHTIVRATRKTYNGKIDKRSRTTEILFTIGSPNYLERKFIKDCKKAKEPFPIKKIQIKYPKS